MKILNIDPYGYSEKAREILCSVGDVEEIEYSRGQLIKKIHDVDVLILRFSHKIDQDIIDHAPELKIIASNVTGVDHIDVEYAKQKGIEVVCLKGEYEFLRGIHATAELTWGLILSSLRNIPAAIDSVKQNEWERDKFIGNDLFGRQLGVIGLGRIGEKVAGYGQAFGMNVVAFDTDITKHQRSPFVTMTNSLSECLENSDVVTIHVPLNGSTHHLVGKSQLSIMKSNSILINTSRGAIVDGNALVNALSNDKIAGAALDVLEGEGGDGFCSPLIEYAKKRTNLLITPHIGGVTHQSWEKTEVFIAEKVVEKIKKSPQLGLVEYEE